MTRRGTKAHERRVPRAVKAPKDGSVGSARSLALTPAVIRALRPQLDRAGLDVALAIRAGDARLLALYARGRPWLPSDWAIPIRSGEVVIACAPLAPPWVGVAALVVRDHCLPKAKAEHPSLDGAIRALADALLADLAPETAGE